MLNIKKKVAMALATTAMGAMLLGAGTFAIFSNSTTNTDNNITAGDVKIKFFDLNNPGAEMTSSYITVSNLAPGNSTADQTIRIKNTGSLSLKYALSTTTSGDLFSNLTDPDTENPDEHPAYITFYKMIDGVKTQVGEGAFSTEIAPGSTEDVIVTVTLPGGAGNAYQDANGKFTITATAQQWVNNH